jgi:putative endonuclease
MVPAGELALRDTEGSPARGAKIRPGNPGLFAMKVWTYILPSETSSRYYCGQTSDLEKRLRQHNDPDNHLSLTTKRFRGPWRLIWSLECSDRVSAMKLEKIIKKRGIVRYLRELQSG